MFRKRDKEYIINTVENSKEVIANQYALKCLTYAMICLFAVLLLNKADIFIVKDRVINMCVGLCFFVYCCVMVVGLFADISKSWVKYYILLGEVVWITLITTFLSFHTLLACALPLVGCSIYVSKRVMIYTYSLMVISTCVSVYCAGFLGIGDANMVISICDIPGDYMTADNNFNYQYTSEAMWKYLSIFFVLPRNMILLVFAVISSKISKILNANMDYARKMEDVAGIDGMTGLFNRSKYNSIISEKHSVDDQVGVIYWDINFLKQVNDTKGHDAGDKLILTVAHSIEVHMNDKDTAYRIGGDEFVMIMEGADNEYINNKIIEWEKTIEQLRKTVDMEISVSLGYACGKRENMDEIIKEADKMMYENKRKIHEERL